MFQRIKLKFSFVFTMLHIGLACSAYGLYRFYSHAQQAKPDLMPVFWLFAVGTALLYGGFLSAVAFIYAPVHPWVHRARKVMAWREWLSQDLPTIIASLPAVLAAIVGVLKTLQSVGDQFGAGGKSKPKNNVVKFKARKAKSAKSRKKKTA